MMYKKSLKSGFSLLELVIGLLISTILITISFMIYQQIARSTQFTQRITTNDTKVMILKDRLQQDLLGITPLWFIPSKYDAMTKQAKTSSTNEESLETDTEKKTDTTKKEDDTQKEHNFFYSQNNQDGTLNLFSFITTSAMQTYGTPKRLCVRVVYLLKKDATKNIFSLLRKEIAPEEFNNTTATSSENFYEIASLIKSCSIEFGFINIITATNKDEKTPTQDANKKTEFTWLKSWHAKQETAEKHQQKPIYPKCIKMKLVFVQEKTDHEQEYELCFITPIDSITLYTSFTQKQFYAEQQEQFRRSQNSESSKVITSTSSQSPNQQGTAHAA